MKGFLSYLAIMLAVMAITIVYPETEGTMIWFLRVWIVAVPAVGIFCELRRGRRPLTLVDLVRQGQRRSLIRQIIGR